MCKPQRCKFAHGPEELRVDPNGGGEDPEREEATFEGVGKGGKKKRRDYASWASAGAFKAAQAAVRAWKVNKNNCVFNVHLFSSFK